jgi:DNA-directed RNA polymerase subunit RPC12/RpoP
MIRFSCPTCQKPIKAPDDAQGRKVPCPQCGQRLLIPPSEQSRHKTVLGKLSPDPVGPMPLGAPTVQWQPNAAPPVPPVRQVPEPLEPFGEELEIMHDDPPYAADGWAGHSTTPEPKLASNAVEYADPLRRPKWLLPAFIGGIILLLACSGIAMLGVGFLSPSSDGNRAGPLTEDQRVAWEKFRRGFNGTPYYIVEFSTPTATWHFYQTAYDFQTKQTFPLKLDQREVRNLQDLVHDAREARAGEIDFNRAWSFSDDKEIDFAPGAREELAQAKEMLQGAERQIDEINSRELALGGRDDRRRQEAENFQADCRRRLEAAETRLAEALANPPKVKAGLDVAVERALGAVTQQDVKAAAVIDLVGGPYPKALLWFRDDGKGATEISTPPLRLFEDRSPAAVAKDEDERAKRLKRMREVRELKTPPAELDASLKAFLHEFQTRADQL